MKLVCKQCGKEFELTDGEIEFYRSKGLNLPKRCKSCRSQNKNNSENKSASSAKSVNAAPAFSSKSVDSGIKGKPLKIAVSIVAAVLVLIAGMLGLSDRLSKSDNNYYETSYTQATDYSVTEDETYQQDNDLTEPTEQNDITETATEAESTQAQTDTTSPPTTKPTTTKPTTTKATTTKPTTTKPTTTKPTTTKPTTTKPTTTKPTTTKATTTKPTTTKPTTTKPTTTKPTTTKPTTTKPTTTKKAGIDRDGSYFSKDEVALYIHTYGRLPSNYITKSKAKSLGWSGGSVQKYAPGKAIGGDRYSNYEGTLPEKQGRTYTECDINTNGKSSRGAERIVFSNDGLIFYTNDHYETFTRLY